MHAFSRSPFSSVFLLFLVITTLRSSFLVQSDGNPVQGAQNLIDQTAHAAENVTNGTVNAASDTKNAAESVVNGTVNAYNDTKNTAESVVNGTKDIYNGVQHAFGNGAYGLLSGQGPLPLVSVVFLVVHFVCAFLIFEKP